jgi:hypothetical protein
MRILYTVTMNAATAETSLASRLRGVATQNCGKPSLTSRVILPGENSLIAILLAAFFILHIFAATILQSVAPLGAAPRQEEARLHSYD